MLLSETKRRAEARYIFKDIQFSDSRRLHELGLRSIDLSYNNIGICRARLLSTKIKVNLATCVLNSLTDEVGLFQGTGRRETLG